MRYLIAVAVVLLAIGCGDRHVADVPLDQVPEPVMKSAHEKLPDVKFEQAWKTANGNYEVRGKEKSGKTRDIQVKPNGEVVEID
jgi:hypothetical protein